ncbi:hypothetical protein K493DRAFT_286823 [Basidiobolus meristosporus CBS 931.73]|uniref:Cyclin N-terminal domain-containing protein n=1 Tax=Basidiobolus meristosporus CBS 931.73 TaxID=1314790 RepID=A0A1Y1Y0B7_9FUNG|nr:hypothetical protein K493DRAFT_286823 [Basidiobolus meristosporus CBS 931.73]|eukprot:ORX91450.1 hypothetical protein K493DRAFT_286823 [Basidiobolus meristosporus CBS 931.73]
MKTQQSPRLPQNALGNSRLQGQRLHSSHSANELRKVINRVLLNKSSGLRSSEQFNTHLRMELIDIAGRIINTLFQCGEPKADSTEHETLPKLSEFIWRIVRRLNIGHSTILVALMYLIRLKQRHPGCKGTHGSGHRLLLAAIIVATKYLYDDAYYNKTWAMVSNGAFSIEEINQMEFELLYFLNFKLHINTEQWGDFVQLMDKKVAQSWQKSGKPNPTDQLLENVCGRLQKMDIHHESYRKSGMGESLTLDPQRFPVARRKPIDKAAVPRYPIVETVHKRLSMPVLPQMWSLLPQSVFGTPK